MSTSAERRYERSLRNARMVFVSAAELLSRKLAAYNDYMKERTPLQDDEDDALFAAALHLNQASSSIDTAMEILKDG